MEETQLGKLIAGLLETNGTSLPPRDRVWPTSCQLGSQAPERAQGLVRERWSHGTHVCRGCNMRWAGGGEEMGCQKSHSDCTYISSVPGSVLHAL